MAKNMVKKGTLKTRAHKGIEDPNDPDLADLAPEEFLQYRHVTEKDSEGTFSSDSVAKGSSKVPEVAPVAGLKEEGADTKLALKSKAISLAKKSMSQYATQADDLKNRLDKFDGNEYFKTIVLFFKRF